MRGVRSLPLRLAPVPGEALDSWLEALAGRLRTPMGELLTEVGLIEEHRPPGHQLPIRAPWLVLLPPLAAGRLSVTTGLAPETLRAMTLENYDQRALVVDRDKQALHRTRNWRRSAGSGSRYCPDCLAESGGRWQLSWRFGWSYACLTHRRLLADACPQCAGPQRHRRHPDTEIPAPGLCDRPGPRPESGPRPRCRYPLHSTKTLLFEADHPALRAQQDLVDTVTTGVGSFGVYRHAPQPALDVLADVKGLGRRVLFVVSGDRLALLLPADLLPYASTAAGIDAVGRAVPGSAGATAATVTAAWSILGQADVERAAPPMRLLLDAAVERGNFISPTVSRVWARYASPWLQTVHVAAVGPTLRSVDQLRYRSAAARPGSPSASAETVARRAAKTPAVLWPRWEARLDPPAQVRKHLGTALSAALMLVDSRAELAPVISRQLGGLIDQPIATQALQALRAAPQWRDIQVALIRLAEYLDGHDVPIDYARRRRLDYTDLLSQDEWVRACERAVQSPGNGGRYPVAKCLLFERVSGLPGSRMPQLPPQTVSFRSARNRFPYLLTPELLAELDQTGRAFLARRGIDEEPLVWEPPAELLDGLDLPRADPERLDLADLHHRVRAGQAPQHIARHLGADPRTLRFVLTEHPAPGPRAPKPRSGRPKPRQPRKGTSSRRLPTALQIARKQLPRDVLEELYVNRHGTFLEIAEQRGLDRKQVARLVDEYGLPRHLNLPRQADGTRGPKELLDRAWLHGQYVEQNRSFKDIGKELGVTAATVSRWAKHHNIPRQNNRHLSRPDLDVETIPALLRPVLSNNYQLRRLHTFLQVAGYRSLSEACAARGLPTHSVTMHLLRLEEEIGGPLLVRPTKNRPMEPTDLGHKVLAAALPLARQLGLPAAMAQAARSPVRTNHRRRPRTTAAAAARLAGLPALLRPGAGTKGGQRRLRRFLEAVRYPTLTAFARDANLDPGSVTLQIRKLERDLDGQLLVRGGVKHAMQLTGLGKKVVAAAQPYADQLGDLHGPRHKPKTPSSPSPSSTGSSTPATRSS
ncbi:TniQ family protein [Streptomyces sp. NBC_01390]|uniref:TniQ family protein n=1 Tax=Streptomyces sp. NBC_01390 TaxID=2903850 RepID=UPI00324AEE48